MAKITTADGAEFDCPESDTILRAALRNGLGMSYSCNVGSCGNCRFELVDGSVTHLRADAPAWSERDLKRNRWLGCQSRPDTDCTIKFRPDPDAVSRDLPARREAELVAVTPLTRDIAAFRFRVEGDDAFRPGQYALLYAPGVAGGRPYSMANLPGDGTWEFLVKHTPTGAATGFLFGAQPGMRLTLDGPYGKAWLREDGTRPLVLVGGGSGLSPMVSIARGAQAAGMLDRLGLQFLYAARSEADLFDAEAVLGADLAKRVNLVAALSEPGPGWQGPAGFAHDVMLATFGEDLAGSELYFAGPAAMSAAVQKAAYEAGLPPEFMHFDEFY